MPIPFWIHHCTLYGRWGSHLWCMAHQRLRLCEMCFNYLVECLLRSCNCSDQFRHSVVDPICNAFKVVLVQYYMICRFCAFPLLSQRTSCICCTWSFFTSCCFSFILFFDFLFVFFWFGLLFFSFSFLLFFFFPFPFFFFWLFDPYLWLIFDDLLYVFLRNMVIADVPIATLLCA